MIISKTPYRVDLIGDGTDLGSFCRRERGCIINAAIKKYIYIIINKSKDDKITIISEENIEIADNVEEVKNSRIREAMKLTGVTKGITLYSIAEAPVGTGLGGSSSFTVGILNALHAYKGEHPDKKELAEEACKIEIDILKEPIGKQDQYAAAFGGFNRMEFFGKDVKVSSLGLENETLSKIEETMMMFYLGGSRKTSNILSEQNERIKDNLEVFNSLLNMRNLADQMFIECDSNCEVRFGEYLKKNWAIKKGLVGGINNPIIENYCALALSLGVYGAKLSGAGGSGFLIVSASKEKQNIIKENFKNLEFHEFKIDYTGSQIIYSDEKEFENKVERNFPKLKGVAFDLEGTVVDLERFHHNAHLEVCRAVGLNISLTEAIEKIPHFVGGPDNKIMEDIRNLGYTSKSVEEMIEMDSKLYEKELMSTPMILPRPGFLEFLDKLKKTGIKYSIGSLTDTKWAVYILEKSGLMHPFDTNSIVLREHVFNLKPSPDVYLKTAQRMGISPEEQIVFEDSPNGAKAAVNAGSRVIAMPIYYKNQEVTRRLKEVGILEIFPDWDCDKLMQLIGGLK
ncbi:MAG: HAD-IA family hydrolase [Candidatus Nanoarchaeia archaeon]|nr:HAD-IA family hydrolase [Candidatus Nanoarchaeia archaeon]MDD5358148.1 HAD-IA family hydrolase [Candidatus Nanoarchaeia archaeon]MDD5589335.1 HAD-IA family hydrolase [Candidatus Nanoarchaeia archaeon]